jgi:hypothetical protein
MVVVCNALAAAAVGAAVVVVDVGAVTGLALVEDTAVVLVAAVATARGGGSGGTRASVVGRGAGETSGDPSPPHPIRAVVSASATLSSRRIFES